MQWTEANCAKSHNNLNGLYTGTDKYLSNDPSLAKLNLVGPLQASKFEIKLVTGDIWPNNCFAKSMRIAPWTQNVPSTCAGKLLSIGLVRAGSNFNPNPFTAGLIGYNTPVNNNTEFTRLVFFTPTGSVWIPSALGA